MGSIRSGLYQRIIVILIALTVTTSIPTVITFAQNPIRIAQIVINYETEENIIISEDQFDFHLKPGECDGGTITLSNTARVGADTILAATVDPQTADFDFDIQKDHSLEAHSSIEVDFMGCLNPHAVIRPYRVDIDVLR